MAAAYTAKNGLLGLQLEPWAGGGLAIRPASKLPPALVDDLRHHKTEVIRLLTSTSVAPCKKWQSIPPWDLPLVALKPAPGLVHRELVIAYLSRQCGHPPLRDWLTRRKAAYYATLGKSWDCGLLAYAAARDAASWQLDRTEAEVWDLLAGFESCVDDLKSKQMV